MPNKPILYCGYADVLVHSDCKSLEDLRGYNASIGRLYPKMLVDESGWIKSRKRLHSAVTNRKNFCSVEAQKSYVQHFKNWKSVSKESKTEHRYRDCRECIHREPIFLHKTINRAEAEKVTLTTPPSSAATDMQTVHAPDTRTASNTSTANSSGLLDCPSVPDTRTASNTSTANSSGLLDSTYAPDTRTASNTSTASTSKLPHSNSASDTRIAAQTQIASSSELVGSATPSHRRLPQNGDIFALADSPLGPMRASSPHPEIADVSTLSLGLIDSPAQSLQVTRLDLSSISANSSASTIQTPPPRKKTRSLQQILNDLSPAEQKVYERHVVKKVVKEQKESSTEADLAAMYSNDSMSQRKWDRQRTDQFCRYKPGRITSHVSKLDSYRFDREKAKELLGIDKNLGTTMNGKWTDMARQLALTTADGKPYTAFNSGQVMAEWAKSEGYNFEQRKVRRSSRYKSECGVSGYISNNSKELVKLRDEKIARGDIDHGRLVFPVEPSSKMRIGEDGNMFQRKSQNPARVISLQTITKTHLRLMKEKGLLRRTSHRNHSMDELKHRLHTENIPYGTDDDRFQLAERLEEAETTLSMVQWLDHSEIYGHAHYLVTVWFVFDEISYKGESELGFDPQSMVERPYVHIIGRSKATAVDQLAYVQYRTEALRQLQESILFLGRRYKVIARYNSGDLPAREFEAGQSGGGDYPCPCGLAISSAAKSDEFLTDGKYQTLQQRATVANSSPVLKKAGSLNIRTLKKSEVEEEGMGLGLYVTYKETLDDMRRLLTETYCGLRRLPALLTLGDSLESLGLQQYEVILTEPLHDLKNIISSILHNLPDQVQDVQLKKMITEFCASAIGERTLIRGCDARLYLVNLTKLMEQENGMQTTREYLTIYRMLYSLTQVQKLAYQTSTSRSERDVLRFYLLTYRFGLLYQEVFKSPRKATVRGVFGCPFHSITKHMPELYRCVSLRSIVAEASERLFHDFKQQSNNSNGEADNVLKNILTRWHYKMEKAVNNAPDEAEYLRAERSLSSISDAARHLRPGSRSILTPVQLRKRHEVIPLLKSIADFIIPGPGVWYQVEGDSLVFFDASDDPPQPQNVRNSHRKNTVSSIKQHIASCWEECLKKEEELKLPFEL